MASEQSHNTGPQAGTDDLLDSWKEIAAYLNRTVRTVQRWEKYEQLPVHRHQHRHQDTVYASREEIDQWIAGRDELARNGPNSKSEASRNVWLGAIVVGVLVIGLVLFWRLMPRGEQVSGTTVDRGAATTLAPVERDWLLIADFDNRTGEEIFDGSLEAILRRELVNSRVLAVASDERVEDTLRLMRRAASVEIDASLAREVALRDGGIGAVLAGRIEKLGSRYLLGVDIIDPESGTVVASASAEAEGHDGVVVGMATLSDGIRAHLGEILPTLEEGHKGLLQVSTPSLAALQLFTRADHLIAQGQSETAEGLLREAISEDPEFASSYSHLAWALANQGRAAEECLPYAQKAVELAEQVTAVERHFIRGTYRQMLGWSNNSDADSEAALVQFATVLELDPGHYFAANNAEGLLRSLERGRESTDLMLRLVDARPNDVGTVSRLARTLVSIEGDLERAANYVERARQLQADLPIRNPRWQPFLEFFPAHELWFQADTAGVVRESDRILGSLADRPVAERNEVVRYLSEIYLDLGMFAKADEIQISYALYQPEGWLEKMAWRRNDRDFLARTFLDRRAHSDLDERRQDALNLIQLGFVSEAEELLSQIPAPTRRYSESLVQVAQGMVDVARRRFEDGIPRLENALDSLQYRWLLGDYFKAAEALSFAWWELGQHAQALEVLEAASRQRPRLLEYHRNYWMDLQLVLAQRYRELGREEDALEIEGELRRYCAFADPDFPVLQELERREQAAAVSPIG